MKRSRPLLRFLLLLLAGMALGAVSCAPRSSREGLSPGEIPVVPQWRRKGEDNPAQRVVALVINQRGECLLSRCLRLDGALVAFGGETPSGGEDALAWPDTRQLISEAGVSFMQLRYFLLDGFDVIVTGQWQGMEGRQFARVYWHLQTAEDVDVSLAATQPAADQLYGLKWAPAYDECRGGESIEDTARRAVEQKLGPPPERLKQEYYWLNPASETAYVLLRYQGRANDRFVLADPARQKGRGYRVESQWMASDSGPVRLLKSYLEIIENVPADARANLFPRR